MFLYTVYPRTPRVGRVESIRTVERAEAVQAVRPVESVWRKQFSGAARLRQARAPQRVQRDPSLAGRASGYTAKKGGAALASREPVTSQVSSMQIQNGRAAFLEQRSVKPFQDGAYIRKYVERLNLYMHHTHRPRIRNS